YHFGKDLIRNLFIHVFDVSSI
ncbi:hypothetical protein TNCT_463361, partial [Trichonephila clavata]